MKIRDCFDSNPTKNTNQYKDYINYIDTSSVVDGRLLNITYLEDNYPSRAQRIVKKGDILYSSVRPSLRHYYYYLDDIDHAVASTGFVLLREKKMNNQNVQFIYYYLSTQQIVDYLSSIAELSQATFPSFSSKDLDKIDIPSLNRDTQDRIVDIISQYDKAIENNNKRIRILEQMAENMYKEWFVRFRFPGYENVEYEDGKPINWEILRLEDFGIILESGSRPSGGIDDAIEDGVPSLGAEAVNGLAEFDYSSVKLVPYEFYEKLKRGKNKGNHILVYKDGAYIGKVTIFRNEFPYKRYAINEHVFFLNSVDTDYQNYLYFTLHQDAYFTTMQNLNRNAAQPGLSKPDMNRIKILVPDKKTVLAFNEFVEPVFDEVFKLAKSNKILIKQRDLLLPRLMSGKLEVK